MWTLLSYNFQTNTINNSHKFSLFPLLLPIHLFRLSEPNVLQMVCLLPVEKNIIKTTLCEKWVILKGKET